MFFFFDRPRSASQPRLTREDGPLSRFDIRGTRGLAL